MNHQTVFLALVGLDLINNHTWGGGYLFSGPTLSTPTKFLATQTSGDLFGKLQPRQRSSTLGLASDSCTY